MLIHCDHCCQSWEIKDSALIEIEAIFRAFPGNRVSAKLVKALCSSTGLPSMISAKQLATHKTHTAGFCFHCRARLKPTPTPILNCDTCGGLNIDISHENPDAVACPLDLY